MDQKKAGYVSVKTLSQYLDIPQPTIGFWIHKKLIPSHKIGYLIRFDLMEIEEWVKKEKGRIRKSRMHKEMLDHEEI